MIILKDIPDLLHHSKNLVDSGFLSSMDARELVNKCREMAEENAYVEDDQTAHLAYLAMEAVKDFTYWLHVNFENVKRVDRFSQFFSEQDK